MVTSMFANSRECGTAFHDNSLLFSFQRPSRNIPRSAYSPCSSPNHRGVTRTSVLAQEGAAYLPQPLRIVKRIHRRKVRRPFDRRSPTSTSGFFFPSSPLASLSASPWCCLRGAASTPHRVPRQEGGSCFRTALLRGARYVAPQGICVNENLVGRLLPAAASLPAPR